MLRTIVEHFDGTLELVTWGGMQPPEALPARPAAFDERMAACAW